MKKDLRVLERFLDQQSVFNGMSFQREEWRIEADLQIHSDASGGVGFIKTGGIPINGPQIAYKEI